MGVLQLERQAAPRAVTARGWWFLVLAGAALGIVSTVWQTVDRIAHASGEAGASICEINALVSCSSVFDHWQSSALGIPNSLIGLPVFALLASGAVSALMGSRLSRSYLGGLLGVSVFMTVFITWYMHQTAFDIGALCLFCAACLVGIVLAGTGLTRALAAEPLESDGVPGRLTRLVDSGADIALWGGVLVLVAVMLLFGLVL